MNLQASAIRSVSFYVAYPVESCDRCSAAIKNVFVVSYRDGETQRYGSECINRILDAEPTLGKLFHKNAKLLRKYRDYLAILTGPVESMPRGQEYYGSGLYFIADSTGKDISFKHWFFHPVYDADKNASGQRYIVSDAAKRHVDCMAAIAHELPALNAEIVRLETFLARILRKATETQAKTLVA